MDHQPADVESDLIDLTEVPLADLLSYDQASLAPATTRLLQHIDDPETIASDHSGQRLY